jgi:hypothetical protein
MQNIVAAGLLKKKFLNVAKTSLYLFLESSNDTADGPNDCRRVEISRRSVVTTSHQTTQVERGQQRRRHQGLFLATFLSPYYANNYYKMSCFE